MAVNTNRRNKVRRSFRQSRQKVAGPARSYRIAGQTVSTDNLHDVRVMKAQSKLMVNKIVPIGETTTNVDDASLNVLAALGIMVRPDIPKSYSLLTIKSDQELLKNENIVTKNFKKLENALSNPSDRKFPNKEDPIYELDSGSPEFRKNQQDALKQEEAPSTSRLAGDIYYLNYGAPTAKNRKLPQFSNR